MENTNLSTIFISFGLNGGLFAVSINNILAMRG
jgi:hypothetical protein